MAEKEEFLLKLKHFLITNYPEDDNIKLWFQEYSEKIVTTNPNQCVSGRGAVLNKKLETNCYSHIQKS